MDDEIKKKVNRVSKFAEQVQVHPQLPLVDELSNISESLKTISEKESPKVRKVSIEGAELVTIKGNKGDKGDEPSDDRLVNLITPLIPEPIEGKKGEPGQMGPKPLVGVDYPTPKDGIDGVDGKDGAIGPQGPDGMDGSPDSPEEVRDKLESLTEEERLDISAIKGMDKIVDDLKGTGKTVRVSGGRPLMVQNGGVVIDKNTRVINFIGAGINSVVRTADGIVNVTINGGGLSTIYTETPSGLIDGVNTTYTVVHTINNVFSLAINGQFLHPTTDYSVTGTTITMVSALDSSLSGLPFTIVYS